MFNQYVVVPLIVWAVAQFLKFITYAAKGRLDFKYLYASGGMPSVHSAVVTSLATTAFLVDGPGSAIFGITVILAAIVMYDSFGVRRQSGEQAIAINMIVDSLNKDKVHLSNPHQRLREMLGHKPLEVTVGAFLGLILGGLLNYDRLGGITNSVTTVVPIQYTYATAGVAAALVLVAFVGRWLYMPKFKEIEIIRQAITRLFWASISWAVIGLILAFLQYQKIDASLWMIWPALLLLLTFLTILFTGWSYRMKIPAAIEARQTTAEKEKWLEGPNKKRRAKASRKR